MICYDANGSKSVKNVLSSKISSSNGSRYFSWEFCYSAFRTVKNKGYSKVYDEFLALHLVGYLASWGMYRGSSALLQKYHYLIHKDLIPIIFQDKYRSLFDIDASKFALKLDLINEAYSEIEKYYQNLGGNGFIPSETLITKIMLGAYGCVPAYDRHLKNGLSAYGIAKSGKKKFKSLSDWLYNNSAFITDINNIGETTFSKGSVQYPFMKLVDMYFWKY